MKENLYEVKLQFHLWRCYPRTLNLEVQSDVLVCRKLKKHKQTKKEKNPTQN